MSTNRGKGKFHEVFLELIRGKCTMKAGGRQGEVLREATVIGATAALLKNARKGHEHAFRLDLARGQKDSKGDAKYVVSVDTEEEKAHWMTCFMAYNASTREEVVRSLLPSLLDLSWLDVKRVTCGRRWRRRRSWRRRWWAKATMDGLRRRSRPRRRSGG